MHTQKDDSWCDFPLEMLWCYKSECNFPNVQKALSTFPNIFSGLIFFEKSKQISTSFQQANAFELTLKIMTVTPRQQNQPLCWCIHPCWYHRGWRSTGASQWPCPSTGWTEPSQSPGGDTQQENKIMCRRLTSIFISKKEKEEANLKLYGAGMSWVKGIEQEVCVGAGICERQNRETVIWVTGETRTTQQSTAECKLRVYLHVERTGRRSAWRFPHSLHHWDTPAARIGRVGRQGEDAQDAASDSSQTKVWRAN